MIKRINSPEELCDLPKSGIEAQKIRALLYGYGTNYDFCRFFTAKNLIMARFYDDFILCTYGEIGEIDFEELCGFLNFSGFSRLFCSENTGEILSEKLPRSYLRLNLMRFSGDFVQSAEKIEQPSLDEAYKVLKTSFKLEFEPWYLDMSHRIRHGISRIYGICGSVLAVQHNLFGEALLSQIATIPEKRGNGNASRLISAVCRELCESKVFVLCEDSLLTFYAKNGFELCGINYELF